MRTLLAIMLIGMPVATFADEASIQVDHVWARAAPAGHEGAVYLTITDGGASDTLTGVTTSLAASAAAAGATSVRKTSVRVSSETLQRYAL